MPLDGAASRGLVWQTQRQGQKSAKIALKNINKKIRYNMQEQVLISRVREWDPQCSLLTLQLEKVTFFMLKG